MFIERPRDVSPDGVRRLAAGIAAHYGVAVGAIASALAAGRFVVKADVDRTTAARYVADLEALGAVCSVVDTTTNADATPGAFERLEDIKRITGQFQLTQLDGTAADIPVFGDLESDGAAAPLGFGPPENEEDIELAADPRRRR